MTECGRRNEMVFGEQSDDVRGREAAKGVRRQILRQAQISSTSSYENTGRPGLICTAVAVHMYRKLFSKIEIFCGILNVVV